MNEEDAVWMNDEDEEEQSVCQMYQITTWMNEEDAVWMNEEAKKNRVSLPNV